LVENIKFNLIMMRPSALFCFLFAVIFQLQAQEFGGNPPSIKWNQIKIPAGRIIFPQNLNQQGERVTSIVDHLYRDTTSSVGSTRKKVNIVLQNQTTITNGYVSLAPWRSEFLLTPAQSGFELGSLPSTDNLAVHEYRHVLQYSNYRKGLSKLLYYVSGESGQALANAASIPNWFFEGDAVFNETAMSEQGRGRIPFFFNGYKSLWQGGKNYSYMKLRNGSLKHYVPDHYPLGYMLVAYGRMKYGTNFWEQVTDDAARFDGLFYPFQKAVKRYSGENFSTYVNEALAWYKKDTLPEAPQKFITPVQENNVTDYLYPYSIGKDSMIVLKKSYKEIPAWWLITANAQQKLYTKSISIDDYYSYRNGKIVYTAYEPDARWGWKDHGVIRILDLKTGDEKRIGGPGKYFSPDISEDGKTVIAVVYDPSQESRLEILDAETGGLMSTVPNPQKLFYAHPKFFGRDRIVASVRKRDGNNAMAIVDLKTGEFSPINEFSYEISDFPTVKGDTILFSQSEGDHDLLVLFDHHTGKMFRSNPAYTGKYFANLSADGQITWSSFTADGYRLAQSGLEAQEWSAYQLQKTNENALYIGNTILQQGGSILAKLPTGNYTVKKYPKFTHPFNFHSWLPYYDNPEWSLTFYGQNILNTFQSSLSYTFNQNEASHAIGFSGAYAAWYPWITGGVSETFHRSFTDSTGDVHWNEGNANLGVVLPLNFTRGKFYKFLTLSGNVNGLQQQFTTGKDRYQNLQFLYLQYSVSFSAQIQQAVQHIYPRFAYSLRLQNRQAINTLTAQQFLGTASLYLPGIARTHNLVLSGAYQERDTARQYLFSNDFPFSRGYSAVDAPRLWRWSVNYHFPLFYPDWGFGQIVYFLRVRTNLFYDDGSAKSLRTGQVFKFRSTGAEIYFDTKWWNQQPLSFGVRYSHLLDENLVGGTGKNVVEFILPVIPLFR